MTDRSRRDRQWCGETSTPSPSGKGIVANEENMSEVIQFQAGPRCAKCRSKNVIATIVAVDNGDEIAKHLCAQHQGEYLSGGLLELHAATKR